MDMDYLLVLQQFREATGNVLTPLMEFLSHSVEGLWPMLIICLVYWAFDRATGRRIIGGYAGGIFLNGVLKLTFCVYRPWIRDARIEPFGDAKTGATGYSFPSGHSTRATASYGGLAIWMRERGHRIVAVLLWIAVAGVLFSRNYLGVHTPQDVIVGLVSTLFSLWVVRRIETWTDKDPKRDLYVMLGGLAICAVACAYFILKPYPLDYTSEGKLLVDPASMLADSFGGVGFLGAYVVGRYFERRGFAFDEKLSFRPRLACAIVALAPMVAWFQVAYPAIKAAFGKNVGNFVQFSVPVLYAMILVPLAMALVAKVLEGHGAAKAVAQA